MNKIASIISKSADSSSDPKSYDVFISFRGEDTRRGFTSHLRDALALNQIRTYIDERLNKGDEISPSLFQAIEDSHISIVVFSKNYASSKWCLDELQKILECKKEGQDVIPVFYQVDPSNIRKLKRSYREAFAKHESDFNNHQDKLNKWKQALSQAANLAGWDSRKYEDESKFLHKIVEDVMKKLECKYAPRKLKCPLGFQENLEPVQSLLTKFPIIGIWGMGGMGKTTIAKWFFDKYSSQYEGSCFLANIRARFGNEGQALRTELISKLLDEHDRTNNVESYVVRRNLCCKRVFVVLDDVSNSKQIEYLVKEFRCFGSGSRIIITTRDKHILLNQRVDKIYHVKALNFGESLQLFCLNAFNQNHPAMGYEELSKRAVDYAKGTPLVLKVLGSFLGPKTTNEWESALKKLNKIPNDEIYAVLKLSYDGLNLEEREIFLEIACFLKTMHKDRVVSLLDSFYAEIGLRTLEDNTLITIEYGFVQMHDLIQEMGWEIVRQESIKEPRERSRLWDPEEIYNVLKNNKGTNKIEGILLDMSEIRDLCLNDDTFRKMSNLRFVKFYFPSNSGVLRLRLLRAYLRKFGDKFRCLQCDDCPSKNLSLALCLDRHLAKLRDGFQGSIEACEIRDLHLNYRSSKLHLPSMDLPLFGDKLRYLQWDGFPSKNLPLVFCPENIVELLMPNSNVEKLWDGVQELRNLERIDFHGSKRLAELPDFSMSSKLKIVNLSFCVSLHRVHPSLLSLHSLVELNLLCCTKLKSLESECHLRSLESLHLCGCISLEKFSVSSEELRELDLRGTSITMLPSSVGRLSRLEQLELGCLRVENLPIELSCLRNLKGLVISHSSRLMIHTQELQVIFSSLQSLEKLSLINCIYLFELPDNIGVLSFLDSLNLSGSNIECLPESIKQLRKLERICLTDCKRLRSVPDLPQSVRCIDLSRSNVESLPISIKQLTNLERLDLCDCKSLGSLPEVPRSITKTSLKGTNIECFSSGFKQLTKLLELDLSDCKRLRSVTQLPQSILRLDLSDCKRLQFLTQLPQSIVPLNGSNCTSLGAVEPWEYKRMPSLDLRNCVKLDEHVLSSILESTNFSLTRIEKSFFILPGSRVPKWFKDNRTTGNSISIKLDQPFQLRVVAFCVVFSPFFSNKCKCSFSVRCSRSEDLPGLNIFQDVDELNSDHVYLWSSPLHNYIWSSNHTCNLSVEFVITSNGNGKSHPGIEIKECGVCPLYWE